MTERVNTQKLDGVAALLAEVDIYPVGGTVAVGGATSLCRREGKDGF